MADEQGNVVEVEVEGLRFTVNRDNMDDIDYLDELNELNNGNPLVIPSIARRVFGDDWKVVKEHLRDEDGKVRPKRVLDFFKVTMEACGSKN